MKSTGENEETSVLRKQRSMKRTTLCILAFGLLLISGCTKSANERGVSASQAGDYDKAIAEYTEAIRLDPKDAVAYYNRGLAYGNKDETDKEIADCTEAIRLDPKFALAYNNRGWAYAKKREKAKAEADFEQAKKLGYKP